MKTGSICEKYSDNISGFCNILCFNLPYVCTTASNKSQPELHSYFNIWPDPIPDRFSK